MSEAKQAAPDHLTRRSLLGSSAIALATAPFVFSEARGQTVQTVREGEKDQSAADPGPENLPARSINPDGFTPPPTDHGLTRSFWNSFSLSHRRIEEGGWSRQVNVENFPISTTLAGVNMKLNAGGIRELHWHAADEWAIMLNGNCRLTAIDLQGRSYVQDVTEGDLWYFPTGIPHSLEGLGPEGCEFLLVFDDGRFSEENTTLVSDWLAHTPREVLAKNWGVAPAALDPLQKIPPGGLYIFESAIPGPLAPDQQAAIHGGSATPSVFNFSMLKMKPQKASPMGSVRIVDSSNFPAAANIATAYVTLRPGAMRELHWHPNADEWQYYVKGQGRMTVFFNKSEANTMDFRAGDVGYVPQTLGHYIENTGDSDLVFLEMFKAPRYQDISLNDWLTHIPPELVMQHLGISKQTLAAIPDANLAVVPRR